MDLADEKKAKDFGWVKLENGGWLVDKNFVTDGFVERHLRRIKEYRDRESEALSMLNNAVNDIVDIVQANTSGFEKDTQWREMVFKKLNEKYPTKLSGF